VIRVALRGLAGRKLRSALTALAIVLGVAMVSGTYVLTDTIERAFDNLFSESYANTDVVVRGRDVVEFSQSGGPTVPAGVLERIQSLDSVEAASGGIEDFAKLVDRDGDVLGVGGAPSLAFSIDSENLRFNPLTLTSGSWPAGPDQVAIDKGTADNEGFAVGDEIGVVIDGPIQEFTISGIARFGAVDSIGGATFALFDTETAQALFHKEGRFDAIQVAAAPGISDEQLIDDIQPLLPEQIEANTVAAQAADDSEETSEGIGIVRYFLLAFGGIALFVGAFVIFNTLSITVAQRTREFATLRTIGASRRQVLAAVLIETLVIGTLASLVGLFGGVGLAKGLNWVFEQAQIELPQTGTVFATRTVVVSLAIGIVISLIAGLAPALRATRVPPIAAVREGATLPPSRLAPAVPYLAVFVVVAAVAILAYGLFQDDLGTVDRLLSLGSGCLLLFVGVALVSSRLVRPLAAVLGRPAQAIGGVAGRLARENSIRNPGRTAVTAAALMIGLALVTLVAVLAEGLRDSVGETIDRQVHADYVVTSTDGFSPFPADAGRAAADASIVQEATSIRAESATYGDDDVFVTGIDPRTLGALYTFDWKQGSAETVTGLASNGALLTEDEALERSLSLGEHFSLTSPDGTTREFVVAGIFEPPALFSLLGDVSIHQDTWDALFPEPLDLYVYLNVQGEPEAAATSALERALEDYPSVELLTQPEFVESQQAGVNILLNMLYVLLALSVVISLFGMVNTLVLSVFERTRELGMLRAIGMTRRQVRRMVRHESVITALIGAALGLPLGVFLAVLVTRALEDEGVVFSLPIVPLVIFAVVAVIAGILAAILPARRAARLNVLEALQYE